ncbi:hypothetical protein GJ744_001798 [Endocarpon pusillum]|uniref:Uncharacterized protein n=1 Tax=Endocarpon pusillum TaxID=364733 RepID=A0A8H7DZ71_9EURO|nr:hypothetical protein GJ744_001798 [Endocarpon pusillum]
MALWKAHPPCPPEAQNKLDNARSLSRTYSAPQDGEEFESSESCIRPRAEAMTAVDAMERDELNSDLKQSDRRIYFRPYRQPPLSLKVAERGPGSILCLQRHLETRRMTLQQVLSAGRQWHPVATIKNRN